RFAVAGAAVNEPRPVDEGAWKIRIAAAVACHRVVDRAAREHLRRRGRAERRAGFGGAQAGPAADRKKRSVARPYAETLPAACRRARDALMPVLTGQPVEEATHRVALRGITSRLGRTG